VSDTVSDTEVDFVANGGTMAAPTKLAIGLVGYGEVGKILTAALVERKAGWVGAWDIVLADPAAGAAMKAHASRAGVEAVASMAALTARADVIISAVTASQAWAVADEAARTIRHGTWFMDLNSCSPGTKQRSSQRIDAAGGRYVESAVMTTVPQYGIGVPMLLGGKDAPTLEALLAPLGFSMEIAADRVGVASAIKMCRSVMIKGLEAMVIESFTSARAWGVEDAVVASLAETFPGIDWERQATYFFQRVVQHGRRRAEEMREVAVTVAEAGLEPWSARGTAERQAAMADLADAGAFGERGTLAADWRIYADAILATRRRGS
jgi:3-hydroxyisobutyrate dehydrogenase-like beta-hydroxyacid dehydrogenase